MARTRFIMSSDLHLRKVFRNFGDDFTNFVIRKGQLGVKAIGFHTSTWIEACRIAKPLHNFMTLKTQIRINAGEN
jgi:hypothetical protein